jgi:peptidoglycan hydrolase-like protein with peptidoglycan-binding domain
LCNNAGCEAMMGSRVVQTDRLSIKEQPMMRATGSDRLTEIAVASAVGTAAVRAFAVGIIFVFACLNAPAAGAQTQALPVAPMSAPSVPNDSTFEAAKRAFDGLPEADRRAVQDALIWASDFAAVTSGSFGKRTFDAILQYQKKHGLQSSGILDPKSQAGLIAEAAKLRQSVNFAVQADARSGVRIALPLKLLEKKTSLRDGTRWDSETGFYSIEVTSLPGREQALTALFDRLCVAGPERKITYKLMRPDWFVVSGESGGRRFYARYAQGTVAGSPILHGYTWSYLANAPLANPLAIAIANSFEPFPGPQPDPAQSIAAAPTAPATSNPVAAAPPSPPRLHAPAAPAKLVATAAVVATGRLLTVLAFPVCPRLTIASRPARLLHSDPGSGLALLSVEDLPNPILAPGPDRFAADIPVLVVGFLDTPADQLAVTPGDAIKSDPDGPRVRAGLQEGAAGSLIFDRSGRWRGAVAAATSVPRKVAGIVPQAKWPVVDAATIVDFLSQAGIRLPAAPANAAGRTAADIAGAASASVVDVRCD